MSGYIYKYMNIDYTSVMSSSVMSLLLYPKTLGNICAQFKSPSSSNFMHISWVLTLK